MTPAARRVGEGAVVVDGRLCDGFVAVCRDGKLLCKCNRRRPSVYKVDPAASPENRRAGSGDVLVVKLDVQFRCFG